MEMLRYLLLICFGVTVMFNGATGIWIHMVGAPGPADRVLVFSDWATDLYDGWLATLRYKWRVGDRITQEWQLEGVPNSNAFYIHRK